jgi:hypothetical protein
VLLPLFAGGGVRKWFADATVAAVPLLLQVWQLQTLVTVFASQGQLGEGRGVFFWPGEIWLRLTLVSHKNLAWAIQ